MLGNLARATYVGSSDYMWPYSYNQCDENKRGAQEINACSKVGHYGMEPGYGRGAPEIDVIEAMQGEVEKLPNTNITRPYQSCSLQVRKESIYHEYPAQSASNFSFFNPIGCTWNRAESTGTWTSTKKGELQLLSLSCCILGSNICTFCRDTGTLVWNII